VWRGWTPSRKLATVAVVLIGLVALVAVLSSSGGNGSSGASAADRSASSTGGAGSGGTTSGGSSGSSSKGGGSTTTTLTNTQLPVAATVTGNKGLKSGDTVTITVKADKGSNIFAVEMRMCRADAVLHADGDELPTVTGQCISKELAPKTDGFKIVESDGSRTELTATYVVGTGTDTYRMDDGTEAHVTCDASHPCVLWVKYQIPNGFGFRTYPLTFS